MSIVSRFLQRELQPLMAQWMLVWLADKKLNKVCLSSGGDTCKLTWPQAVSRVHLLAYLQNGALKETEAAESIQQHLR